MHSYQSLLRDVLTYGERKTNRTGVDTIAIFGCALVCDLTEGFPAVTTKKLFFKSVAAELAGFLEGTESAARMRELGTAIWTANANAEFWQDNELCRGPDDMGPVYGSQWRNFGRMSIDQLGDVVQRLINDPNDRRLVVTAWNPMDTPQMCLPPCHTFFQFYVRNKQFLDCQFYMRSVDSFLGMPFDIASYALLTHIVAQQVDLVPGMLSMCGGDTHIYTNHRDQVNLLLSRDPLPLPQLDLWEGATIDNFHPDMAKLVGYKPHPYISAKMAV